MRAFRGPKVAYTRRKPREQVEVGGAITVDTAIVERCVPLWRHCAERAHSRYGGTKPGGNPTGRSTPLRSVDDELKAHGIEFGTSPYDPRNRVYRAYVSAVVRAAQGAA